MTRMPEQFLQLDAPALHAGDFRDGRHHAPPVGQSRLLQDVYKRQISFYDMAQAIVAAQQFENNMLKAYIRDWPAESAESTQP